MKHQALLTIQAKLKLGFFLFYLSVATGLAFQPFYESGCYPSPNRPQLFFACNVFVILLVPDKSYLYTCWSKEPGSVLHNWVEERGSTTSKSDLSTKHPRWSRRTEKLPIFIRPLAVKLKHVFLLEIRNGILLCFTKFVDVKLLSSVNLCILFWCNLCIYLNVINVSILM